MLLGLALFRAFLAGLGSPLLIICEIAGAALLLVGPLLFLQSLPASDDNGKDNVAVPVKAAEFENLPQKQRLGAIKENGRHDDFGNVADACNATAG